MKNLHSIGLSDLEYAALYYQTIYSPQFNVFLRLNNNILECRTPTKEWEKVKQPDLDKLFEKWAEEGRPKYPGTIDRI